MTRRRKQKVSAADALRDRIEMRAGHRCEYCHAPQAVCGYRFHLEHVRPTAHGGSDSLVNRALACASCNLAKSDKMKGTDPITGREVSLFHPRRHIWNEHFRWSSDEPHLLGMTPIGRATIAELDLNAELRLDARRLWFETGWLP